MVVNANGSKMYNLKVTPIQHFRDFRSNFKFKCVKVNPKVLLRHALIFCFQQGRYRKAVLRYTQWQ